MKAILRIFRLPRKLVFIIGGMLLLGGATGAFALYIGKDKLLGSSANEVNGLECTDVKTFNIKKKDRYWVRKFIKVKPSDGILRVTTALRVAKAVYQAQKPDLVQVVVLDENGPELRADMRGRAVGADLVYVPHPEKIAELIGTPVYAAKYVDGLANPAGQFYGEKIQVPAEQIEALAASLSDQSGCIDPSPVVEAEKGGHEKKKPAEGHGEKPAHGEEPAAGHGEAAEPAAESHGEAPAASEDHAAAAADDAKEDDGYFGALTKMVFGEGEEEQKAEPAAHGKENAKPGHDAAVVEGEEKPAADAHAKPEEHVAVESSEEEGVEMPAEAEHGTKAHAEADQGAKAHAETAEAKPDEPSHDAPAEDEEAEAISAEVKPAH